MESGYYLPNINLVSNGTSGFRERVLYRRVSPDEEAKQSKETSERIRVILSIRLRVAY